MPRHCEQLVRATVAAADVTVLAPAGSTRMARTSLNGVWKLSASLRGRHSTLLPKHIRFTESPSSPPAASATVAELGSVSVPYAEHCGGTYEIRPASSIDEPPSVGFIVECASTDRGPASRLSFDGLYDGERIAGTVHDREEAVADFLCTRLFTFWGTPKPRAGEAG